MSAIDNVGRLEQSRDNEELPSRLAEFTLGTSSGGADQAQACWRVVLSTDGQRIRRDVWLESHAWNPVAKGWEPEGVIWPTWPATSADEAGSPCSPLEGVEKYWNTAGNRLRDSAKWMAAVLGAAVATVVGTSPLAPFRQHHPAGAAILLGLAGLVLLSVTLFLVLQVMRPQSVSYTDVQTAIQNKGPLGKWRQTVESQEDLYLPCGVKCLTSLRQSMIIEQVTLMALAKAREAEAERDASQRLGAAEAARAARLVELRVAAARIAMIGEYYKLRERSTRATYGGVLSALLGSACIIAAFAWPVG